MSWIVPTGCFYIAVRSIRPYTDPRTYNVYTYTSGQTVTNSEHIPSTATGAPIFLLADFDNGYIYTRSYDRASKEYPLFVIDASNQTVSFDARSMNGSYGIVGSSIYICASKDALSMGSSHTVPTIDVGDFVFGNGTGMLDISAFPSGVGYSAEGAFKNRIDITSATLPNGVASASSAFYHCTSLMSATLPNSITTMIQCFAGCTSLVTAPTLPTGLGSDEAVNGLLNCFDSCTSLTMPPTIPNGTKSLNGCFRKCTSLAVAPEIPSSVIYMTNAFYNCTSLSGNVIVNNEPTSTSDMFAGTVKDLYIIVGTSGIETTWENITSQYSNVHYEANDNAIPSLSMRVTRVSSSLSEIPSELGEYAYISATVVVYSDNLPVGWTDSFGTKTLTKDGTTISPTWTQTITDNTYTLKCWVPLGDIVKHTFTLQVTDTIKDANNTTKATHQSLLITQSLSKTYKLIDYYHESDPNNPNYDTEGMAIGKFATEANLFDVDMPALFRNALNAQDMTAQEIQDFVDSLNI